MTTTATKAYAVLWVGGDRETVHTLVYRPPTGPEVRTYRVGHLDPRAGIEEDMPRFDTKDAAWLWLTQHVGEKCLVELRAARLIYGQREKFAEPV